jgi:hypothetical protein
VMVAQFNKALLEAQGIETGGGPTGPGRSHAGETKARRPARLAPKWARCLMSAIPRVAAFFLRLLASWSPSSHARASLSSSLARLFWTGLRPPELALMEAPDQGASISIKKSACSNTRAFLLCALVCFHTRKRCTHIPPLAVSTMPES